MLITNSHNQTSKNIQYYNQLKRSSINFQAIQHAIIKPSDIETRKIVDITELFQQILKSYKSLNGISSKKISDLYPKLIREKTIHGFVINNILPKNETKFHIVTLGPVQKTKNICTFNILSKDNKKLLEYTFNKNSQVEVTSDSDIINSLPINPFDSSKTKSNMQYLDKVKKELTKLKYIVENYASINRRLKKTDNIKAIDQIINEMILETENSGQYNQFESIMDKYKEVFEKLYSNPKKTNAIKIAYFGIPKRPTNAFIFKDADGNGSVYKFTKAQNTKNSDRLAKIEITDKDENLLKMFIFHKNGKVSVPIKMNSSVKVDERDSNLKFLSKTKIKEHNISGICTTIYNELEKFGQFIDDYLEKNVRKKSSAKITNTTTKTIKPASSPKPQKSSVVPIAEHKNIPDFVTKKIVERINGLFNLPIENRPKHLRHRTLLNGHKFTGEITFDTSDGKEVTITKMRVLKYIDTLYYSIKINDQGKQTILNLDPFENKFILSNDKGQIIYNSKNQVQHISKEKLAETSPEIINLPKYIYEMIKR